MKNFKELLEDLDACNAAKEWAQDKTIEQVVHECHRGDWLLWLGQKINIDIRTLTLAKAKCAKTVIHLMSDHRSIDAVNAAEDFCDELITLEELQLCASAASSAAAYYAASSAAAYYAASAASSAAASAAYYAANVAYYAAAANDAYYAAATSSAAYYAAATSYVDNNILTANICRDVIGEKIITRVNELLIENK